MTLGSLLFNLLPFIGRIHYLLAAERFVFSCYFYQSFLFCFSVYWLGFAEPTFRAAKSLNTAEVNHVDLCGKVPVFCRDFLYLRNYENLESKKKAFTRFSLPSSAGLNFYV